MAADDAKQLFVEQWKRRRAQGKPAFLRGRVITFLILAVAIIAIDWIREGKTFVFSGTEFLVSTVVMGVAGWLYGLWVWNHSEKRYHKFKEEIDHNG